MLYHTGFSLEEGREPNDSDLFWCAVLPVQPPLLPVWTHHISDYRLSYMQREEKEREEDQKRIHNISKLISKVQLYLSTGL